MKLLLALTLFATLGLALARDFFVTLGIEATYPMIGAFGLAVTTLLIFRSVLPLVAVGVLSLMIAVPEEMLQSYHLDHDILLAAVLIVVMYPWLKKVALD